MDHHRWETALRGLRADALDCLQSTLALIADRSYHSGAHVVLGCRWRLRTGTHDGMAAVCRTPRDRLTDAADLLGLRAVASWTKMDGPGIRRLLADWGTLYVVGEAYDMPWLPYAGHQRMEHSFLLKAAPGGYRVVDPYHNNTPWGPARPGTWTLTADGLDLVLSRGALAVALAAEPAAPRVDVAAVLAENAARARSAGPEIERYVAASHVQLGRPGAAERLALDTWALSRERLLHAAWLAERDERHAAPQGAAAEAARLAEAWQRLATAGYLAMRRAQRGAAMARSCVDDLGELLRADAAFAAGLSRNAGPEPAPPSAPGMVPGTVPTPRVATG